MEYLKTKYPLKSSDQKTVRNASLVPERVTAIRLLNFFLLLFKNCYGYYSASSEKLYFSFSSSGAAMQLSMVREFEFGGSDAW